MNNQSITRRIIAIIFSAGGAGALVYLTITGSSEALTALVSITGTIIGFYFGAKSAQL